MAVTNHNVNIQIETTFIILFQIFLWLLRSKKQKTSSWNSNFDGDKGRKKPAWVDEDDDKVL